MSAVFAEVRVPKADADNDRVRRDRNLHQTRLGLRIAYLRDLLLVAALGLGLGGRRNGHNGVGVGSVECASSASPWLCPWSYFSSACNLRTRQQT